MLFLCIVICCVYSWCLSFHALLSVNLVLLGGAVISSRALYAPIFFVLTLTISHYLSGKCAVGASIRFYRMKGNFQVLSLE